MNALFLDVETTGATNNTRGNPFTIPNKLCYIGVDYLDKYRAFDIEYGKEPYGKKLDQIRSMVSGCSILVGFNLKFDLHWLRRYGISEFVGKKLWDCQTFEYLVSRQQKAYPSLGSSCEERGLGHKMDIVKTEYWEKGIDTDAVPASTLEEYLRSDVIELTKPLYLAQQQVYQTLTKRMQTLINLSNQDLLVLEEMEWNGLPLNFKASFDESQKLQIQLERISAKLNTLIGTNIVNWNSGDHISCILYGGTIKIPSREKYLFQYKSGKTTEKERSVCLEYVFPALVTPIENSELKKDGYWSTNESTLRKLRGDKRVKQIIGLLLEQAKLEKLKGTYFDGFSKLHKEMQWEDGILHGQLNQPVTTTGRLASSRPNLQNIPDPIRGIIQSQYA